MSRRPSQAELLAAAEALAGLNSVAPSTAGSPTTPLSPTQAHATLPDASPAEQNETKVASTKRKASDAASPQNEEEEEEEEEEQEEDDDDEEYEEGSAKTKGERQWYDQIANAGDSSDKTNVLFSLPSINLSRLTKNAIVAGQSTPSRQVANGAQRRIGG